jgi:nicotinamide-nucleotide amidase
LLKTEILSIGTEIATGQNLDTNSQWLSLRLAEAGIPVHFHTTVDDDLEDNVAVFRLAAARANLVICTGGLGPTADDLTREALAKAAGVELVHDEASFASIREMFAKRNREMPERNKLQALFPAGATPIPNPNGTAPGIWLEIGDSLFVCLPGVPREMFAMFTDWVLPRLRERFGGGQTIVYRILRSFGSGESHIEAMLGDLIRRGRDPEVGITASEATISLRIIASGATHADAYAKTVPDAAFIRQRLGDLVFGEDDDELQTVVGKLLAEQGKTVATAESCTGGLIGHLLTEVPGSSRYYVGGAVVYSNALKTTLAGVPAAMIEQHGAVSPQVAEALARGCRERFGADYGIGVTGVAGPDGGTPTKPVGLVYVGLAHAGGAEVAVYNWPAERSAVKLRSAKTALNVLRLHLLKTNAAD